MSDKPLKLTPLQWSIIFAMRPGKWYQADELPYAKGQTYHALIRRGLIETKQFYFPHRGHYMPLKWTHAFRRVPDK